AGGRRRGRDVLDRRGVELRRGDGRGRRHRRRRRHVGGRGGDGGDRHPVAGARDERDDLGAGDVVGLRETAGRHRRVRARRRGVAGGGGSGRRRERGGDRTG